MQDDSLIGTIEEFPSPTGVNYYEWTKIYLLLLLRGFRPQQGLTIMNPYLQNPDKH